MNRSRRRWPLALALALVLALPACQRPEDPLRPADLVPRPQLVAALVELHLLEARVENAAMKPDSARALFLAQQKSIFWSNQLTDSSFQHSVRYYGTHGKDLDDIYGAVIDSLEHRTHRLDPKRPPTPPRPY
ncbi:DUF4296 domain-containing protein [Hymenobacter caeli]|uniref:DUF4296 domain-containing protein n=1 Tax=Hymenobacter caeli TaxID=2735894 RepID=A0ABX2FTZ4_9BACT|nr:DUF4296 domain-containing protein [Hymenobacter caeli]NRT20665.1 hypothetical protein [Hymenobacter caeli]